MWCLKVKSAIIETENFYFRIRLGGISSLYDISIYFYKWYGMKQYR